MQSISCGSFAMVNAGWWDWSWVMGCSCSVSLHGIHALCTVGLWGLQGGTPFCPPCCPSR